jgi:uncharacterized membrane protein YgaE (UPF0421/DUF939 family)
MATKSDIKWKVSTLLTSVGLTVAVLTNFVGLPSCSEYETKAHAKEKYITYEQIHKEVIKLIHANALAIGVLDERTKGN